MIIMKDEIPDYWRRDETGECEDVWDGVDVFVRCEAGQDFEKWFFSFRVWRTGVSKYLITTDVRSTRVGAF